MRYCYGPVKGICFSVKGVKNLRKACTKGVFLK